MAASLEPMDIECGFVVGRGGGFLVTVGGPLKYFLEYTSTRIKKNGRSPIRIPGCSD